jgi:cadmium resistance protein CadD (predicted permease)
MGGAFAEGRAVDESVNLMAASPHSLTSAALLGVGLFASTNIDDIFLNMAFFADQRLRRSAIVAGKFVGIGLLTLLSAIAAAGSLAVSPEWIALLGFVPLGLGLHALWTNRRTALVTEDGDGIEQAPTSFVAQVGAVAGVTAANGGDNLGVYVPVFAEDFSAIPVFVLVFALMTALWCVAGNLLVSHPRIIGSMRRLSRRLLPYVLIILGVWILSGAVGLVLPPANAASVLH